MSSKPKQFTTSKVGETRHKPKQFTTSKAGETGDRPREFATFKKMNDREHELKQFAVCWTSNWPENFFLKNKPTHVTINLGCALGKVQRAGTGLTQTVLPQAPMRGLSALNGDLKDLRSQARAPDELPH